MMFNKSHFGMCMVIPEGTSSPSNFFRGVATGGGGRGKNKGTEGSCPPPSGAAHVVNT